ncbi:MAG: hypothetical protein AAB691_04960 [Patescibacteria group bacterium]
MKGIIKKIDKVRQAFSDVVRNYPIDDVKWRRMIEAFRAVTSDEAFDRWPQSLRFSITFLYDVLMFTPREQITKEMLVVVAKELRRISAWKGDWKECHIQVYEAIRATDFETFPQPLEEH